MANNNVFTKKNNSQNSRWKSYKLRSKNFFSKLSGAVILPIIVAVIAGLFQSVGSAIASNVEIGSVAYEFGNVLTSVGRPIFNTLPLIFAASFALSFTNKSPYAVFATIIGYLVFISVQNSLIFETLENNKIGYRILFSGAGRDPLVMANAVETVLGLKALNTSIFGGFFIGMLVTYIYNKFKDVELPGLLAFFGGKRFTIILTMILAIPLALIVLVFWPWFAIAFSYFGAYIGQSYGFDSFLFGFVERALIPFGLHHVFYAPLWWSQLGGDITHAFSTWENSFDVSALGPGTWVDFKNYLLSPSVSSNSLVGDQTIWQLVNAYPSNSITWTIAGGNSAVMEMPVFEFVDSELGLSLGRFQQGKYPIMLFGLPAAGLAMIAAAPKGKRKIAAGAIIPALIPLFLSGITEPIEYTFLFLAPWIYYGFHAVLTGISFLALNLLNVHIGMTFSGGLFDFIIYGVIPILKGTNFYWVLAVGGAMSVLYFSGFYWAIKKFNLMTPGRGKVKVLATQQDIENKNKVVLATSSGSGNASAITINTKDSSIERYDKKVVNMVKALGGVNNLVSLNNCATRLRYDLKDSSLIDKDELKAAGAIAVVDVGNNHIQIIMGPSAEQVNGKIKRYLEESFNKSF